MNRAERRDLQRRARKAIKGIKTGNLAHPVPDSITLDGGPMTGWIVKPDAPALHPDWIRGLWEARAAGLYNAAHSPTGETAAPLKGITPWAELDERTREPFREKARVEIPGGKYVLEPSGRRATWQPA